MFGFLKSKRTRGEEFLKGATDIHCHILPGVDDGFASLSTSFELLDKEEAAGVKRIYLTPHSMGVSSAVVDPRSYGGHRHHHHRDASSGPEASGTPAEAAAGASAEAAAKQVENSSKNKYESEIEHLKAEHKIVSSSLLHAAREKEYSALDKLDEYEGEPVGGYSDAHLKTKFEMFKSLYKGGIDIRLAAEYMMNKEFLEKVKKKELLTYSDGVHVLVETSYYSAPLEMDEILYTLQIEGFKPILAHPERYRYMSRQDYEDLKSKGIEFQLTYLSLTGYYGKSTVARALDLLDSGYYNFTGSDYHRTSTFVHYAHRLKLNKKRTDALKQLFENNDLL